MPTISLRDYQNKLRGLLKQENTDQVIRHCRHILQYFPKNVRTYRILGQALNAGGRHPEAGEVFRRVLSVFPDDYDAHYGLYQSYKQGNLAQAALWHLERAHEIKPDNTQLIDLLREEYRRQRNLEVRKLPVSSAAAARQFRASRLYNQAIDTIQEALKRQPDRADLRVLLILTFWEASRPRDAVSSALEVLQQLPDCYEANRIAAQMWLDEGRSSDALPYLSSLEQLDPYGALEVVRGEAVDDSLFTLEELDFRKAAERELIATTPDWLGSLGVEDLAFDTQLKRPDELDIGMVGDADDFFAAELPADWLAEVGELQQNAESETNAISAEQMASMMAGISPTPARNPNAEDPLAWLGASGAGMTGMLAQAEDPAEADPLAWLNASGAGMTGMLAQAEDPAEADPLAWL
ncbi:MAG: tetratricopeptide repeat protein, partial [Phototrophicaceae bacterium]